MTALIQFLLGMWEGFKSIFVELFREAIKFTTVTWGVVLIVAGLVWAALEDAVGALNYVLSAITSVDASGPPLAHSGGTMGYLLSVCNTFAPMDELFSYSAAYLVLMGAFGLYHLIKSWIPTVAAS